MTEALWVTEARSTGVWPISVSHEGSGTLPTSNCSSWPRHCSEALQFGFSYSTLLSSYFPFTSIRLASSSMTFHYHFCFLASLSITSISLRESLIHAILSWHLLPGRLNKYNQFYLFLISESFNTLFFCPNIHPPFTWLASTLASLTTDNRYQLRHHIPWQTFPDLSTSTKIYVGWSY